MQATAYVSYLLRILVLQSFFLRTFVLLASPLSRLYICVCVFPSFDLHAHFFFLFSILLPITKIHNASYFCRYLGCWLFFARKFFAILSLSRAHSIHGGSNVFVCVYQAVASLCAFVVVASSSLCLSRALHFAIKIEFDI